MQQQLQNKKGLVNNVFNKSYDKYDLMNDIMSFGIHRIWKKDLMFWMSPNENTSLIDVGAGTGDIAKLFSEFTNKNSKVLCIDPNKKMLLKGKKKLSQFKNIKWKVGKAEKLPTKKDSYNYYSISFGLRNTKNISKSLSEAFRVLKPGGHFLCLEFSKVENESLEYFYNKYSKCLPSIGSFFIGDSMPYKYLTQSIKNFVDQETLLELIKKNGFKNCSYRNLSGGIVAIHSGWKI
tara:strand:+ start:2663 stop:3367 length:705 start_codon:yes stop_codon:yes gene_type:complete